MPAGFNEVIAVTSGSGKKFYISYLLNVYLYISTLREIKSVAEPYYFKTRQP
jgi:hypothetical protein